MIYLGTPCYLPSSGCLSHHGILGQKWGIRRYQNKDGTLTEAGKRRLAKIEAKASKYEAQKRRLLNQKDDTSKKTAGSSSSSESASSESSTSKSDKKEKPKNPHLGKSVFSMNDDELRSEINRLNLEKQYLNYMRELYMPESSKRKKRGQVVMDKVVKPALTNVGKNVTENVAGMSINKLGKMLGLEFELYTKSKKKKSSSED